MLVSYFQAGSICDYVKERWGDDKLLDMAHSFAQSKTTPEVIQKDLQMPPEEFDKAYGAWLDKRAGQLAANFDAWAKELNALASQAKEKQNDAVVKTAPEVLRLYPMYVGDANAYEFMAEAQLAKGDKQSAATTLTAYEKMGGQDPDTLTKLASLKEELGHPNEAAATLDRINYIYPESEPLHRHLGQLWLAQKNYAGAIREYTAVLALNPLDKASAQYNLAQAYFAAGQINKAEESVLLALETAPGFRPAQKLLLDIKSAETNKPDK